MVDIVVVGGGFGGVHALFGLEGIEGEVLLIEPHHHFVFTPLLHEVAGGVLHKESVTMSYHDLLPRVKHRRAKVEHIDYEHSTVTADGKTHAYDYLVLSPGARTNFHGKKYNALELKTYEDAVMVRATIEQNVILAAQALAKQHDADVEKLLHVVVIGGGPTGVELAGEVMDLLRFRMRQQGIFHRTPRVTIVHSHATLLSNLHPYFHKSALKKFQKKKIVFLEGRVEKIDDVVRIKTKTGVQELSAACVIWTAGVTPNAIAPHQGAFEVLPTLQLHQYPNVFAIGDAALMKPPLPALAQVATKQGEHVAKNIRRLLRGNEPLPFRYKDRGMLISVGQRYGIGMIYGVPVKGFFAWFLMRTVYLFKFRSLRQELKTAREYTLRLFFREKACARIRKR